MFCKYMVFLLSAISLAACEGEGFGWNLDREIGDLYYDTGAWDEYGLGGSGLRMPFPSGKYWALTQGYNTGSHVNYGFSYGDDSYALDFSRNGCDAYGQPVTAMAMGKVIKVTEDGHGDQGYGNSVLIAHGAGYVSRSAHFSENLVEVDDIVDTNDYIGKVGNSGYSVGAACSSHPGTHLHVALYRHGEGIPPEPISGQTGLITGCWYNREGDEHCGGDPGDYDPEDGGSGDGGGGSEIDDEGELDIRMMDIYPDYGTADQTEFVWVAVVDSPDAKPDATLVIHNTRDDHDYDFEMRTESKKNPWVFTYQKTLRDASSYRFWVEASNGDGNDTSSSQRVSVSPSSSNYPRFTDFDWDPSRGREDETEFEWEARISVSGSEPDVTLHIVNPSDARVYDFDMDVRSSGSSWRAEYEKVMRDETVYTFWATTGNGSSANASEVGSVETY